MTKLPKPLPRLGPVKSRQAEYHKRSRAIVMKRCQELYKGLCEGCQKKPATEWSHLFGRRNTVSEPFASSPELTCGLCRGCHDAIDRYLNPALRMKLQNQACFRFATAHHLVQLYWAKLHLKWEPRELIQELIREVETETKEPA